MSLYCDPRGPDEADWYWYQPAAEAPLTTPRSRKCCSCDGKIHVGGTSRKVRRYRPATAWEEMRGLGDEAPLPDWYLCEKCGDLADSIAELGFCYTLGGASLAEQVAEYRREEESRRAMENRRTEK